MVQVNIGAFASENRVLGFPYYKHSIIYPPNPILIIKAPIVMVQTPSHWTYDDLKEARA